MTDPSGPIRVNDQHPTETAFQRFNARLALAITALVGTMGCAYAFAGLALIGLPPVLGLELLPSRFAAIVLWTSSEFLQLVLLSVIMVGQNVQARASDARSEATYADACRILDLLDFETTGGLAVLAAGIDELHDRLDDLEE